jgi:hypothetical protein
MKDLVRQFIKQRSLSVISTINLIREPESALVGIAVSADLEIVFDTVETSRKYLHILHDPRGAFVIG